MQILAEHDCDKMQEAIAKSKSIDEVDGISMYGTAIFAIVKTEMGWICHNGEYATHAWHCPFCGTKLD